jgi:hypothetical protein
MLFVAVNLRLGENTGMQQQAAALALRDLVKSLRFETAPLIVERHQLARGLDTYAREGGALRSLPCTTITKQTLEPCT